MCDSPTLFFSRLFNVSSASLMRRMYVTLYPANMFMVEQCHPSPSSCSSTGVSSSARFLFRPVPAIALEPGPQFGVGFCWYLTSLTLADGVVDPGCLLKFATVLR